MGTRHFIGITCDGIWRVAQYGQWDGYISGVGIDVLNHLNTYSMKRLAEVVRTKPFFITDTEISDLWNEILDSSTDKFYVSEDFEKQYPHLSRNCGANIIKILMETNDERLPVMNRLDFVKDSLFCEFAYIVDFDYNTFEVYTGFNTTPLTKTDRFYDGDDIKEYYPVKLFKKYSLDDLPSSEEFLKLGEIDN